MQLKDEDPTAVIRRLHYKLDKLITIRIINTGIEKPESQLEPFSNEYKANLYAGIFIRKNNDFKWNNKHPLNGLIKKHCLKDNPSNLEDWKKLINKFDKIVPRALATDPNYQYVTHQITAEEQSIYVFKNDGKNNKKGKSRKRKRYELEIPDPNAWAKNTKEFHTRKRFKGDCYNCGGHGHVAMNCTKSDATSGTLLNINQNTKCYRCHRKGHVKSQCWARYYCKHTKEKNTIEPPAQKPMKYQHNTSDIHLPQTINKTRNATTIKHQQETKCKILEIIIEIQDKFKKTEKYFG